MYYRPSGEGTPVYSNKPQEGRVVIFSDNFEKSQGMKHEPHIDSDISMAADEREER